LAIPPKLSASMGGCVCSYFSAEARRNRRILRDGAKAAKQEAAVQKLLLLGAGGSGKSTFFKQLRLIHGKGINRTEIENTYRDVVYSNVLNGMQTLVEKSLEIRYKSRAENAA